MLAHAWQKDKEITQKHYKYINKTIIAKNEKKN
jgi:hypothetical protein